MKKLNINKARKKIVLDDITKKRLVVFLVLTIILFSTLIISLVKTMIVDNSKYKKELVKLSYTTVYGSSAPRGRIFDRNGNIIVDNKAVKTITYKRSKTTTTKEMIALAKIVYTHLDLNYDKVSSANLREYYLINNKAKVEKRITKKEWVLYDRKKLDNDDIHDLELDRITDDEINSLSVEDKKIAYLYYLMNKGYTYDEKDIKNNASDTEYAYISEHNEELTGFNTKLDWERVYPYGDTFRSILGSVSSSSQGIPAEDKTYYLKKGYALNDRVGISYLEKEYEDYLKGTKAIYQVVNSHELKLVKEGKRGKDIVLSIDINLQKQVEDILSNMVMATKSEANTEYYDHSSVIIQDPNTGEILAMASKRYDNGKIVDNTTSILTQPVTPGSIVKGGSILVGYNTGAIHIGESLVDECIKISGIPKEKCSYKTLGLVNDITALAKSSNVYQFKTAIRVSGQEYSRGMKLNFNQSAFDKYRAMYHSLGLGVKTGIDLPVESSGYTSTDKAAGNLLDFVIGQYETYTPIQISQYITTIANSGSRLAPHLLKEVHESSPNSSLGKTIMTVEKKVLNTVDTDPKYMARVHEGFYAVIHSAGGYGVGYINSSYSSAGKTGTSQSFVDTNHDGKIDTETITSSFIGYMPSDNPKMSITVISPNSSHPNSNINYASLVTYHLTQQLTNAYVAMYGN